MSYVSAVLISVFLSSIAEAHRGNYSLVHTDHLFNCRNCSTYGSSTKMVPVSVFVRGGKAILYPTLIWPSLPVEKLPYLP